MGIKRKITKVKNELTRAEHMLWSCEDILYFSNMTMSHEDQVKATETIDELQVKVEKYKSLITSLEKQYTVIKVCLVATSLIISGLSLYLFL